MDILEAKQIEPNSDLKDTNNCNQTIFSLKNFNNLNNSSKLNTLIENLKSTAQYNKNDDEDNLDDGNDDEKSNSSSTSSSSSSISSSSSDNSSSSSNNSSNSSNNSMNEEENLNEKCLDYNQDAKNDSTLSAAETLLEIKNFFSKTKNEESKNVFEDEESINLKEVISPSSQHSSIDEEQQVLKELQNDFSENGIYFFY
jgi:hypothetical protein